MRNKITLVLLSTILISTSLLAQDSKGLVDLPIKPLNNEKIPAATNDSLLKQIQEKFKKTQQEHDRTKVTVDPGTFLDAALNNPKQTYKASDGKEYKLDGSPVVSQDAYLSDFTQSIKQKYSPQQKVTLFPGGNVILPVAGGLGNTIKTNFKSVAVKTSSSDAVIDIEQGYIVITPKSSQPVDLKIYEEGVLDTMVNVTVVPFKLPPAMIDLKVKLNGSLKAQITAYQKNIENAARIDEEKEIHAQEKYSTEYVNRIKEILTPVAKGEIPQGFTLSKIQKQEAVSPCNISIAHTIGQRIVGAREIIDVVLVKNTWDEIYPVQEENCYSEGVMAVAIYDNAILQPGQTTELYIVRDKLFEKRKSRIKVRPRLDESMFMEVN